MFAQIGDLAFDTKDNLFVLDRRDKRIFVFDPTGRLIREHNKRGSGPGEMQNPFRLAVTTTGHLFVIDQQIGALLVWDPKGEPVRNISFAEIEGRPSGRFYGDDRGGVLIQSSFMPPRDSKEKRAEIIARIGSESTKPAGSERPVGTKSLSTVVTKLPMPALIPFGSRDKDEWNQSRLDRVASLGPPPPGMPVLKVSDFPFAEQIAVVYTLRTDPTGRIWVQRRKPNGEDEGPIDVLTASGRYIGTLPAQPLPRAVSASGLAAYVVADDMGVERVVVKRIPAAWK